MVKLISCIIALFIVHGIPYMIDKGNEKQREANLEEEFRKRENY